METKGIEEMTREDLIELVCSLNRNLVEAKAEIQKYEGWWKDTNKRIQAAKLFMEVL